MDEYTIYCTPEQTRKALQLGAPIMTVKSIRTKNTILSDDVIECDEDTFTYVVHPTVEQMIGWLRSKGFRFKIDELSDTIVAYKVTFGYWYRNGQSSNPKEATLDVIDIALEYLSKKKVITEHPTSEIVHNILRDILHFEQHHEKSEGITQYIRNKYEKHI